MMDLLFGPLPMECCKYFYAFTVIFGGLLLLMFSDIVTTILFNKRKIKKHMLVGAGFALLYLSFGYFSSRLLHTICVQAI